MRFAEAASLYTTARRATATRETVASPGVRQLAQAIRSLSRLLADFSDDELWMAVMRRLRRTLRDLGSTPLSPSSPAFGLAATVSHLQMLLNLAKGSYADELVAHGELALATLTDLSSETSNPFGDLVADVLGTGDLRVSALLVKTPHIDQVATWLSAAAPGVGLVTESDVARLTVMESLVAAGPSYWFPAHLLTAPRAESTCFVHYDAIRDEERPTSLFRGSHHSFRIPIRPFAVSVPEGDDHIDSGNLLPTVDWEALSRASGGRRHTRDEIDAVPATLFLLSGGLVVYLEATEESTIDVLVDLEPDGTPQVTTRHTRDISPGDYIVLRSEGGSGDYIPSIADALLGKRAAALRAAQRRWKDALRDVVRAKGFARVERELRSKGVGAPNLRYRLWRNSLRSRDPNDFRILMDYIGLGADAAAIWNAMGELHNAHMRAAKEVRKLLEKEVLDADPRELLQTGRIDVRLAAIDAGTLSVVRVEARAPDAVAVHEDDLRVVRAVERDLWQG